MDLKNMDLDHYVSALVHSKEPEDVQYGIDNLESVLGDYVDEGEECEHLYMLAVGYFRKGDYKKSKGFVDSCLMIEPEWEEPKILKKFVECRLKKGGVTGIAAPAVVVTVTLVAVVGLWRSKRP
ncbi:putative mitochondria fission 1 protein [Helianthus annuus]|nr:putative mitochondria fission 1 protein [Helianthus annuus]